MTPARRALVELAVVLVFIIVLVGAWWWQESRREEQLAAQAERCQTEATLLRDTAEFWASTLADSEARAAFRAFVAGITPSVLAGRNDSVDLAVVGLLDLPGIEFAHVIRPDGSVISSSDRKLGTSGSVGERGAWALAASEVTSRTSNVLGVAELAAPVPGPDGPVAFVWVGYRTEQVREETRPAALAAADG